MWSLITATCGTGDLAEACNCLSHNGIVQERNPEALLHPFMSVLSAHGLGFQQALFVPPESSYRKLGSTQQHQDLSWQHGLQRVYQKNLSSSLKVSKPCHGAVDITRISPVSVELSSSSSSLATILCL